MCQRTESTYFSITTRVYLLVKSLELDQYLQFQYLQTELLRTSAIFMCTMGGIYIAKSSMIEVEKNIFA